MSKVVTTRLSEETLEIVDRLAAAQDRSRAWILSRMIEDEARRQAAFEAFIQEGEDDIERGDFYTQEEMEAWAASQIDKRKKAA